MELTEEIKDFMRQYGEVVARATIENFNPAMKRERTYLVTDPEIYRVFPELKPRTLRQWVMEDKAIGTKGRDNKWHVKLSEIERHMFPNQKRK